MQLLNAKVPVGSWNLWDIGDFHVGSTTFHEEGFLEIREQIIEDGSARVVVGGDLIEAITIDDRRFDMETNDPALRLPLQQCEKVVELLEPIKKKIVCVLEGNHERKLRKYGYLVRDVICRELGIVDKYGTSSAKISYEDKHGLQFKHYTIHGFTKISSKAKDPIQRIANMKASAKDKMQRKAGDCGLMTRHHNHLLYTIEPHRELYVVDDGTSIKQKYYEPIENAAYIHPDHRWYGGAGSFYKTYGALGTTNYAEEMELDPVELGCLKFEVRDRKIVAGYPVVV